jgi:hypothetical protein
VSATSDELRSSDPLAWLLQISHDLPPPELAGAVSEAMAEMGASASCVYLADYDQHALHPFGPHAADRERLDLNGTTAGRAYVLETTLLVDTDDGALIWLPLIDGTARIGVVVIEMPDPPDDSVVSGLERLASLAAELFVSKGHYTDAFEVVRRREPMALQAELQRSMLPPVALVTPRVAVAGMLLPAYEVAGDSFDYTLNADHLNVAVIDSVGHDLHSSLISHVVQGSLRNSRRNGIDLVGAYAEADEALIRVFADLRFATSAFGHLELATGRFGGCPQVIRHPCWCAGSRSSARSRRCRPCPSASAGHRRSSTRSCSSPGTQCCSTRTGSSRVVRAVANDSVSTGWPTCSAAYSWRNFPPPRWCGGWRRRSSSTVATS